MSTPGETSTRLGHVIVESSRTQRSLVEAELGDARKASNVSELHSALWGAAGRIYSLGHYDSVDVVMQLPPDATNAEVIDAYFTVREKPVPMLTVGSYVKESGVVLEASGKLRTPFGYGETIDMSFSKADNGAYTAGLGLTVPHLHPNVQTASVHARDDIISHEWHSSFVSKVQSVTLSAVARGSKHAADIVFERRDEVPKSHPRVPFAADASSTIVSMLRPSTKVGLKYTYTDDTRDSVAAPSKGKLLQATAELAVPPGNACFFKSTLRGEFHKMIGPKMFGRTGLTWSTGGSLGCLVPFNTKGLGRSFISDRFFVGGPMNIRGFDLHGIGPRAERRQGGAAGGDALGGEVMYSLTSMLSAPVPFESLAKHGFRAIAFANLGSLMAESRKFDVSDCWKKLRASVGCGLLVDVGAARVEITYSTPIRSAPHDVWRHFQLGIGISLG